MGIRASEAHSVERLSNIPSPVWNGGVLSREHRDSVGGGTEVFLYLIS
jgi:hypothetical protein